MTKHFLWSLSRSASNPSAGSSVNGALPSRLAGNGS